MVLLCIKEHLEHFLMQSCVSKNNGKDMLDSFINIYVHPELIGGLAISCEFRNSLRCDIKYLQPLIQNNTRKHTQNLIFAFTCM